MILGASLAHSYLCLPGVAPTTLTLQGDISRNGPVALTPTVLQPDFGSLGTLEPISSAMRWSKEDIALMFSSLPPTNALTASLCTNHFVSQLPLTATLPVTLAT